MLWPAAGGGVADEGDYGGAHPEGVEGGGDAVVGDRVEGERDLAVGLEVGGAVGAIEEVDARGVDGIFLEGAEDNLSVEAGGAEKQEAGVGNGGQEFGPEVNQGRVDLGGVVQ